MGAHVGDVGGFAGGVDHQEQVILGQFRDHQIVENAALGIGENAIAGAARLQTLDIAGNQGFQPRGDPRSLDLDLPHVGDVEQTGLFPDMTVFGHDSGGVPHRHRIAGEGHHLAPQFPMKAVERRGQQCLAHFSTRL